MRSKNYILLTVLVVAVVLLQSCMPGGGSSSVKEPAGFFMGVWHGWIAPISLLWSLFFDHSIRIYETYNTGWWYDLGFYIAIIGGFGGAAIFRKKKED